MKQIKLMLITVFSVMAFNANAQTTDEIVGKYLTAMGGKEKLLTLTSVKMTGSLNTMGLDIPITFTKVNQVGARMDIEVQGTANYQFCNSTEGWVYFPIRQMAEPTKMTDEEYKSFSTQLDLQGPLVNYKEKGNTVEFLAKETLDGGEAYKLKVTFKNGKVSTYYIDVKSNFLVKTVSMVSQGGREIENAISYTDFKQNTDGYWFPYTSTNAQGPITFEKIETNIKPDESIFKK